MFGIVRLIVLCLIAFVAGVLFERQAQAERCIAAGGVWESRVCLGGTDG